MRLMGGAVGLCLATDVRVHVEEDFPASALPEDRDRPLLHPPIHLSYMHDRIELAKKVLSKEISGAYRLADESITKAREVPEFRINVRYTLDEGMRAMYESTVRSEDVRRSVEENVRRIEEGLRIRNEVLELTNENYFNQPFAELSPISLAEARDSLTHSANEPDP